jgi:glycosyltransferase involved in cell wall biosynthesis
MASRGHHLTIVCGDMRLADDWKKRLLSVARCRFGVFSQAPIRALWQVKEGILSRARSYDALYTNGQGSSVLWFARAARPRFWVHHHHMAGDEHDQGQWTRSYKTALKLCDTLVGCAELNSRHLSKATGRSVKTVYCFSRRLESRRQSDVSNRRLRFGYFGRLIPAKGIPTIISLSGRSELEDIEWHVWGAGADFTAGNYGNSDKINFHGSFASDEELNDIVQFLDGFVLFSTFDEGLPVSLLEVTSAGLPWIATERGGIAEIAIDAANTILLPATPDIEDCATSVRKLAEVIRSGSNNPQRLTRFYAEKFSQERVASEWEKCFIGN